MAKNSLVINIDIREIRVALIEDGILVELHLERDNARGTLGNVYLGKVSRVLPGMQAAFIDIGQERAAFLHVEDLIRPDDFEAYLAGQRAGTRHHDEDTRNDASANPIADDLSQPALPVTTNGHAAAVTHSDADAVVDEAPADDADDSDDVSLADPSPTPEESVSALAAPVDADDDGWSDGDGDDDPADAPSDEAVEAVETASDDDADDEDDAADEDASDDLAEPTGEDEVAAEGAAVEGSEAHAEDGSVDVELEEGAPGEALADGSVDPTGDGADGADGEAGKRAPRARSRRGRGRRRSGKTADRRPLPPEPAVVKPAPREAGRRSGKDDKRRNDPLRVSKSTPIREVVREGQEVIVQVSKEPIGTKGARVTSHISLPGRYVVYLPTVEHVGISKRIGSDKERSRLREAIDAMKPPTGGLIVRTLAEGLTKKSLKSDVGYLVRLWGEIAKNRETARAPDVLYSELDLVLRTARDLFTDDIEEIVIDNRDEYVRLRRFIDMFMPERAASIRLYEGDEPIFDAYGIEDEIGRALSRKVPLPSGGHLIIDQAEALTAIDVNTGRFVGKGSRDLEDTILQTNLEAVEEIAYQLRFRNIGGLIILDLIDMERTSNREKVRRKLEQILLKDKAKTTLNRISELGLIEMTRKRTRESLGRQMNEPCFYCDGTGNLQSKQTVALEILRQIKREKASLRGYSVVVNAHPAIVDLLRNEEREAVTEAERKYMRRIELVPRREYHLEQFDLVGK